MTRYSSSQINKLKSRVKNGTEVTFDISSKVVTDSNDETNFPRKLLLPDGQVSMLRKACTDNSSANIKLSKTQLSNIVQLGEFFCSLLAVMEPTFKEVKFAGEIVKILIRAISVKEILQLLLDAGYNFLNKEILPIME